MHLKLRNLAKISASNPVSSIKSTKDIKLQLQGIKKNEGSTHHAIHLQDSGDGIQATLLNLHQSIESELGILGSASAIALAQGMAPHKPSENKRLKKESKIIVKKMNKGIQKFKKMKKSLNMNLSYLEDANSSGDEEYKK